jgi:hypothetical protein
MAKTKLASRVSGGTVDRSNGPEGCYATFRLKPRPGLTTLGLSAADRGGITTETACPRAETTPRERQPREVDPPAFLEILP